MIKKRLLPFLLSFLLGSALFGQSGSFKFAEESFDFGTISEGTQATHEFTFTNTGTTPIVISNVRASCGCTTPDWTKDSIPPGGTGVIKASYNSKGRPGVFNKSITITSNAAESQKVLYIKGVVDKAQAKQEYSEEELKKSAKVKLLDNTEHDFGKIEKGQKVTKEFSIKNTGKSPLVISKAQSACNCITHTLTPASIPPGKKGVLQVTYSPHSKRGNRDILTVITNDLGHPEIKVTLTAEVVEE